MELAKSAIRYMQRKRIWPSTTNDMRWQLTNTGAHRQTLYFPIVPAKPVVAQDGNTTVWPEVRT